jgi:predicted enzyme related to lactoylglutathione lyase
VKVLQLVAFCLALAAAACVSTGFYPALIALPTSDVRASAQWYVRNAGFTLKSEQADRALLEREQFQLALEKNHGCSVKLTFHVKDIDDVAARLRAHGVKFQTEPHDDLSEGTRAFTVLDNEGNWIEFIGGIPGPSVPGAAKMSL